MSKRRFHWLHGGGAPWQAVAPAFRGLRKPVVHEEDFPALVFSFSRECPPSRRLPYSSSKNVTVCSNMLRYVCSSLKAGTTTVMNTSTGSIASGVSIFFPSFVALAILPPRFVCWTDLMRHTSLHVQAPAFITAFVNEDTSMTRSRRHAKYQAREPELHQLAYRLAENKVTKSPRSLQVPCILQRT
jgi:hypothetical protein